MDRLQEKKKRVEYLDVLRGLTILMIVSFHVLGETILVYHHFVDTMGLQVFLFVSGYFYNGVNVKTSLKKIVLPYCVLLVLVRIIWNIRSHYWNIWQLKQLAQQIILGYTIDAYWENQSFYVGISWFLTLLVSIRVIYQLVVMIGRNNYFIRGLLATSLTMVGTIIGNMLGGEKVPWSVDVAMATMIFVFAGDLAHACADKFLEMIKKWWLSIPVLCLWWGMVRIYDYNELATRRYPNGMTHVMISGLALVAMIMISYFLYSHLHLVSGFLQKCGKYSLYILCAHIVDKSCITYPTNMSIYVQLVIEMSVAVLPVIYIYVKEKVSKVYEK